MELSKGKQGHTEPESPMPERRDAVVVMLDLIVIAQIEAAEHRTSPC